MYLFIIAGSTPTSPYSLLYPGGGTAAAAAAAAAAMFLPSAAAVSPQQQLQFQTALRDVAAVQSQV
jgi:hypothetical protein